MCRLKLKRRSLFIGHVADKASATVGRHSIEYQVKKPRLGTKPNGTRTTRPGGRAIPNRDGA